MIQIDIHIPRPWLTLGIIAVAAWYMSQQSSLPVWADATGGSGQYDAVIVRGAEQQVLRLREEQQVLGRREKILRAELALLEEELMQTQDQAAAAGLVAAREELLALLDDQRAAEEEILLSLRQIWDAQGVAVTASRTSNGALAPAFEWPVTPEFGISATFHDAGYKQRFGMEHQAVDIPVEQGSSVYAAAEGIVEKVSDNGLGYSSLVIRHSGGYATLYGHLSGFLVKQGDNVRTGQAVALSGGTPGTRGAGHMTTGAHLHFEMLANGAHVDPLEFLPAER